MSAQTIGPLEAAFYRRLVGLAKHESLRSLLDEALDLLISRAGAREAVIEVLSDVVGDRTPLVAASGCDGGRQAEISRFVSRGIISEAMASGETVVTANAAEDPRFSEFESVRKHRLEAVLCVPIGREVPVGIIYIQGQAGAETFTSYDEALRADIELLALAMAAPVERLLSRSGLSSQSPRPVAQPGLVDPFDGIIGSSRSFRDLIDRLRLAAPLEVHILFTGPSGAGKTRLASAVHLASARRARPFVEINCATLPESLLENELFGAEPGAHSAVPRGGVRGKVEAAEGGTLFLDEVAELSVGAQAKLLQLLQSHTYHRLGGSKLHQADVRVLAATNVDLKVAVAEKRFREDLYYRLFVLEARVPPLSERTEDLIPLSSAFLRAAVERHSLPHKTLSPSAIHAIRTATWDGNVRELANRIESATIHAHLRGSDWIEGRDVFPDVPPADHQAPVSLQEATRRFQRQHVLSALESSEWNVMDAAQLLDVSRSQVYVLIRAFDLRAK